jgi:hypothetical protein
VRSPSPDSFDMSNDEQAIRALVDHWMRASITGDLDVAQGLSPARRLFTARRTMRRASAVLVD